MRIVLFLAAAFFILSCTHKSHLDKTSLIPSTGEKKIVEALQLSENKIAEQTGVYTLESGTNALIARLWLFAHAQRTVDIQYYSVAKDITGVMSTECLIRTADRGVKVRLLIDDAASKMYNRAVRLLDSHENIEVRVYNAGLKLGSLRRKMPRLFKNGNRLLRRMHNKCVLVDDVASITGGRNIADEYYDYDHHYNFRDRDVLFIGKAAKETKKSFEDFWNDSLTVPFSKLSSKLNKKRYREPGRFNDLHEQASDTVRFSTRMRRLVEGFSYLIHDAEQSGELIWTRHATFVSDKPGKNEKRNQRNGGVTTDSIYNLFRSAKHFVDLQSPYFISAGQGGDIIKESIQHGVKYRLLTNSLASIDNFEAYGGYLKSRKEIIDMGIDLHEFKPYAKEKYTLLNPETQAPLNYKAVFGLHAKSLIIDSSIVVIGSYNVDPRSANYNTECLLIIRSKEFAKLLAKPFAEEVKEENSWKVTKDFKPDKNAPLQKRLKAFFWILIPKKLL